MPTKNSKRIESKEFAVCLENTGFIASLEVRKLYPVVSDPDAEANDLIRVIDESGEDYLYPSNLFQCLNLPSEVQRALCMESVADEVFPRFKIPVVTPKVTTEEILAASHGEL